MEKEVTTRGVGLQYGVIAGIIMIIYGMILQLTDMATNQGLAFLNYLFLAVVIFLAHKKYKETGDGFLSYGQGLGIGFWVSLAGGILAMVFSYVYMKFIDSSMMDQAMEKARYDMEEQGMSDAQVDQAMSMTEKFMTPEIIFVFGILGVLFFGFILSLIISAITKKTDPQLEA